MTDLVVGLALCLFLEGIAYALFPERMQRMMAAIMEAPPSQLRGAGLVAAGIGLAIVWIVRG